MRTLCGLVILLGITRAALGDGTLVVCDDVKDPMTLDPQKEFSEKNHTIIQQIYEGLVRFGPEGAIEPALATAWKRLDDKTMQFKLRQGVFFHNGEPFNAESVVFSIQRYLDPATGFPARGFIDSLDHAQVIAEDTVNLTTKYPDGLLLNRLAGFIVMVPPRYFREQPNEVLWEKPVGTGAFEFERWEKGNQLVLRANKRYWDAPYPKIERLVFKFIPEARQVDALLSGKIDVLTSLPGTQTLEVQKNKNTFVIKKPTFYTVAGNFNLSRKPLSNKRVRQAINLAIDRKALVRYDIFGNGIPIGTLTLPGEFGHNELIQPYPYDPQGAMRILREEGYANGFSLKVFLKVNAQRTGQIIARQLARIKVKLEPVLVTDAEIFRYLQDRSQWDMMIFDCPDPMHHAFFLRSIYLAGQSPFSLSADAGIDERLKNLVGALDTQKQKTISEELDRYIYDEFFILPTYQRLRTYGIRKGVHFTPYLSGMPYFYLASTEIVNTP